MRLPNRFGIFEDAMEVGHRICIRGIIVKVDYMGGRGAMNV